MVNDREQHSGAMPDQLTWIVPRVLSVIIKTRVTLSSLHDIHSSCTLLRGQSD